MERELEMILRLPYVPRDDEPVISMLAHLEERTPVDFRTEMKIADGV
jgi:hypothetical protein